MKILAMSLVTLAGLSGSLVSRAADFDGDSRDDVAVFRPSTGLWAVRGVTRAYFGGTGDEARPGDFNGDGIADIAIYRGTTGLWAVRGVTRTYFGSSSDTAIQGGGGQRTYDYVVKPNDGDDLKAALESETYNSVYIPAGYYSVGSDITVDNVQMISGAGTPLIGNSTGTTINLGTNCNLILTTSGGVTVENLMVQNGGGTYGQIYVTTNADYSRLINVHAVGSDHYAFNAAAGADYVTLISCMAFTSDSYGFYGFVDHCAMTNCRTKNCDATAFYNCDNLSGCIADGGESSINGFYSCERLSSCLATGCTNHGFTTCDMLSACEGENNSNYGFYNCSRLSACKAMSNDTYGFGSCNYLSACYAFDNGTDNWYNCNYIAASNN
ncbi:MAG TPA: VCBS repeat-containing protein [bacterium]|nr:VCBS repeat-containing protein [bacterium]